MTFTFKIKEDLLAELVFSGRMVCHDTVEEHARPVRGKKRVEWAEAMQDVAPREEHLKRLDRMQEDVYQSGNRDMAPSKAVLRKIASERNISKRRDDDEMKSLDILKKEQEQLGENAVLRVVIQNPAGVMLWSKACIRIFHRRCLEDVVYLDATWGVIKNRDAPFYAYELVVRNALKGPFCCRNFRHLLPQYLLRYQLPAGVQKRLWEIVRLGNERKTKINYVRRVCSAYECHCHCLLWCFSGVGNGEVLPNHIRKSTSQWLQVPCDA